MEFIFYFSVAYFYSLYLAWLIVFCWCQKGINLPVVFRLIMINLSHNSLAVHGIVVFLRCSGRASKNEISETKICVSVPRKNFIFRMRANFEMEGLHVAYNGKTICRVIVRFFSTKPLLSSGLVSEPSS